MPDSNEKILEIRKLKTHFPVRAGVFKRIVGHVKAVDDVNLDIYRGEVLGLVGESGCGKTTLGKSIVQLVKPTSGTIVFHGKSGRARGNERRATEVDSEEARGNVHRATEVELTGLTSTELAPYRKKMQIVFQDPHSSLNPAFTVFGSLEDPLKATGIKKKSDRRKIIGDILESVNLQRDYMDRYPNEFSGGQRQRIGIARALSVKPELIVCDEAVSALDVSIQAQVLQLLIELKEKRNLTYLFITHDLSVGEYICDRIAVMYLGKIVELASSESLFNNTLHPYTRALLSAIPVADLDKKTDRIVLQGDVPSPVDPPSGCPFHPRCPEAMARCKQEKPELKRYQIDGQEHYASCHLITHSAALE